MAYFTDTSAVKHVEDNPIFSDTFHPGEPAPYSAMYICTCCGEEMVESVGRELPPCGNAWKTNGKRVVWKVLIIPRLRHVHVRGDRRTKVLQLVCADVRDV